MTSSFCSVYVFVCYNALSWESEILRIGIVGSISTLLNDSSFHFVDTLNIRAKAALGENTKGKAGKSPTMTLMRDIWKSEGFIGFTKGFTACFYNAVFCGFIYFSLYKWLKPVVREQLGVDCDPAFCYLLASLTTEAITVCIGYPYNLIKCRI